MKQIAFKKIALLVLILVSGCFKSNVTNGKISSVEDEQIISGRSKEVIEAINNQDMIELSNLIHPDMVVRFSPYSYVRLENDLVFSATQIKNVLNDKTTYSMWKKPRGS